MLTKLLLQLIGPYLDGQDAARASCTCKHWYMLIKQIDELVWKKRIHLVMLNDVKQLDTTIAPRGKLIPLSNNDADAWLRNIFLSEFDENIAIELELDKKLYRSLWRSLYAKISGEKFGEGSRTCFQDLETKELVFVNNYYGSHCVRCLETEFKSPECIAYTCTPADHRVETIEQINGCFPGLISNWKHIHFPISFDDRHLFANVQDFHRGSCLFITINSYGLDEMYPIQEDEEEEEKIRRRYQRKRDHDSIQHGPQYGSPMLKTVESRLEKMKTFRVMPYDCYAGKVSW